VVSPEGPYIIKLLENVNKLAPYTLIRQTLRVGNAATMINGIVRLLLAKMSVGGITNFIGLTKNAEDGMNLLQRSVGEVLRGRWALLTLSRIISAVLYWDSSDFKKSVDKIEKLKDDQLVEHLNTIKTFVEQPDANFEAVRRVSQEQKVSIVMAILKSENPEQVPALSEAQHAQCMEYYSVLLSLRDRQEFTNTLCRQNPDLFTQALKEVVAAFDPLIRQLHDKIDLREHVADAESFIGEFIEVGKGRKSGLGSKRTPSTTKDYVDLLHRSKHMMYKWLHRIASQTPEIRELCCDWAVEAIKVFRNTALDGTSSAKEKPREKGRPHISEGAGAVNTELEAAFSSLTEETRALLLPILDTHATYLVSAQDTSTGRMQAILDELNEKAHPSASVAATRGSPGVYLASWQNLLDETLISPETPNGPLRRGRDVKDAVAQGKLGAGAGSIRGTSAPPSLSSRDPSPSPMRLAMAEAAPDAERPDSRAVVEAMGQMFREMLVAKAQTPTKVTPAVR
jgi:hypothetical protein